MEPADLVQRSSDRAREQIADPILEEPVRRQRDRILNPLRFERLVDLGIGEAGVTPEIDARNLALISRHDGLYVTIPPRVERGDRFKTSSCWSTLPNSLERHRKASGVSCCNQLFGIRTLPSTKRLANDAAVRRDCTLPSLRLPFQSADALRFTGRVPPFGLGPRPISPSAAYILRSIGWMRQKAQFLYNWHARPRLWKLFC